MLSFSLLSEAFEMDSRSPNTLYFFIENSERTLTFLRIYHISTIQEKSTENNSMACMSIKRLCRSSENKKKLQQEDPSVTSDHKKTITVAYRVAICVYWSLQDDDVWTSVSLFSGLPKLFSYWCLWNGQKMVSLLNNCSHTMEKLKCSYYSIS